MRVKIGQQYRFIPSTMGKETKDDRTDRSRYRVVGQIDYINWMHRWFRVAYHCYGVMLYECFKFENE